MYDLAEFYGSLDGDMEMWERFMLGYSKFGQKVDVDSLEFLVNQYLIFLDSYLWYAKSGRADLEQDKQDSLERVTMLREKIKLLG